MTSLDWSGVCTFFLTKNDIHRLILLGSIHKKPVFFAYRGNADKERLCIGPNATSSQLVRVTILESQRFGFDFGFGFGSGLKIGLRLRVSVRIRVRV
jgi:hypothetical protein